MILAAAVALTGCKIEDAEWHDPTYRGYFMFQYANYDILSAMSHATRVLFFDLYYSAPEEERETIHNRYFYKSRIYNTDDEWHIVNADYELIIYTGGKSLYEIGTTWRYCYANAQYSDENDMPSLTSRAKEDVAYDAVCYDYKLPYDRGLLKIDPLYKGQGQSDGTVRYWIEAKVEGAGKYTEKTVGPDLLGTIEYEIVKPLSYNSWRLNFSEGEMKLSSLFSDGEREAEAKYFSDGDRQSVVITYNGSKKVYY